MKISVLSAEARSRRMRKRSRVAAGIEEIQRLADGAANDVLRDVGAVFRPFGFQDADGGIVHGQQKAILQPEIAHLGPYRLDRGLRDQPLLVTGTFDAQVLRLHQNAGGTRRRFGLIAGGVFGIGCRRTARHDQGIFDVALLRSGGISSGSSVRLCL